MKTYFKTFLRMIKKHSTRLISLTAIVIISVGFMSGLGSTSGKINTSVNNYYLEQNVADIILKKQNVMGFSTDEITKIKTLFGEDNVMIGSSFDSTIEKDTIRLYYWDLNNIFINKLELLAGTFPQNSNEVLVERKTNNLKGYAIGDIITYNDSDYKVSGIVINPLIFAIAEEPSYLENEHLTNVIYFSPNNLIPITDLYITLDACKSNNLFSDNYESTIVQTRELIETNLNDVIILSLYDNYSFYSINAYTDKINNISIIFIIFFVLITALVVLSTMTRLLEEERREIACLQTLGYNNFLIITRYLIFSLIPNIIGGIIAVFIGIVLVNVIYIAFGANYDMPAMANYFSIDAFALALLIITISSLMVTFLIGTRMLNDKPAQLLLPKAPKTGKKVIIERIGFIWNRLSFKYKSSFRNILRYKSHFLMTVISIAGSTMLILAGIGLLDNSLNDDTGGTFSLIAISLVLIVFAALLTALVIYNLTNISISERNREIATLMVLGYYDNEVSGYISREILMMSIIGAIIGIPIGYLFLSFVFNFIDYGSVANVNWYTWVITPCVAILFTIIVSLLLRKKIVNTDMNESLKSNE